MRIVKIKTWIPAKFPEGANSANQYLPQFRMISGTGCWGEEFDRDGLFHQWAITFIELSDITVSDTIALVELKDGTIEKVDPSNIKFLPNI